MELGRRHNFASATPLPAPSLISDRAFSCSHVLVSPFSGLAFFLILPVYLICRHLLPVGLHDEPESVAGDGADAEGGHEDGKLLSGLDESGGGGRAHSTCREREFVDDALWCQSKSVFVSLPLVIVQPFLRPLVTFLLSFHTTTLPFSSLVPVTTVTNGCRV